MPAHRRLEALSEHLRSNPKSRAAAEALEVAISASEDTADLLSLAERWFGESAIAIPALERAAAIEPGCLRAWQMLGTQYWLSGRDEAARACLAAAIGIDSRDTETLLLKATLAPTDEERTGIYRQILRRDPENLVAVEWLAFHSGETGE